MNREWLRVNSKVFLLGLVAFVTSFGAHVVAVNLPVYAKQVGAGLAFIGILIAAYDFAEIFAKPVFGWIADRGGLKETMLVGIAFFAFASLLYLGVPARLLVLIRFLQGLGAAALSITSAALVAAYFKEGRGKAFGIYNAMKGAGYVLGPSIGGAIVWKSCFSMIFVASFGVGMLAFVLSLFLPRTEERSGLKDDEEDLSWKKLVASFREPILLRWYAVIVINMFMVGILFGFLPVYVSSLGYDQLRNGMIVTAATTCYLLIQPLAGRLADRIDPIRVVAAGLLVSGLAIVATPFVGGVLLVGTVAVGGLGVGAVWTNTDAAVSNLAKEGHLAATLGMAGSFKEFGDMTGPLLIGVVSQLWGLRAGVVVCGVLGLAGIVVLLTGAHRTAAEV